MSDTCKTCKAWGGGKADTGRCQRIPPMPNGVDPASWPMTNGNDWCTQWIAREQKNGSQKR